VIETLENAGACVSTRKVAEGPAAGAGLPASSKAVEGAIEMPSSPFPLKFDRVTVLVDAPVPLTEMSQLGPLVFRVILLFLRSILEAFE
jgi:hypothetical protein